MKIIVLALAILTFASVAMADELTPIFIKIKDIVDLRGQPSGENTRSYMCNLKLKDFPDLKSVQLIVADGNGNIGIGLHNTRGEWYVIVWSAQLKQYGLIVKLLEGMQGPDRIEQLQAIEHAEMLFDLMYKQRCLLKDLLTEKISWNQDGMVLCCCESLYGGQCCKWMSLCSGSYIPGCICK